MRVIKATIPMIESRVLIIGFVGENERTQVRIDCTAILTEYPHASPTLAIKPPVGAVYPVVVNREDNEVVWDVSNADLQNEGYGELQLTFVKDGVVAKTVIGKLRISRSLLVTGEQPDVIQTWYDAATEKLAEVDAQIVELEGMVDTATDAATRAEQSESDATAAAQSAATSAATASAKAAEAQASANTATAKASEAALSATQASNSAMSAVNSESVATAKAAEAAQSAQTATTKAEQATEAAQTATEKAGDASASARAAQASATDAAASATAASASETAAKASETAAGASATQAAQSVRDAGANAQTAILKAAEASQSATNAEASATNAATSAETASTKAGEAAQSAQAASDAKTAVEQTAEQLADSLEQIEQNTQDIADHEQYAEATYAKKTDLYKKADIIHSTASGAIASFPDGAEMPVDEVTMQINPVQDLHGYENPWPAGGGVNKADLTGATAYGDGTYGMYVTVDGEEITLAGTWTNSNETGIWKFLRVPNIPSDLNVVAFESTSGNHVNNIRQDGTNNRLIITATNMVNGQAYTIKFKIVAYEGSTAPTAWTPYSNICPISGFEGLTVTRTGKNLLPTQQIFKSGNLYSIGTSASDYYFFKKGTYAVSNSGTNAYMYWRKEGTSANNVIHGNVSTGTFTLNEDCRIRFWFYSTEANANFTDIQIESGTTATTYEPYQGETYPITFPTESGTVYGGSLSIAEDGSGVLTVDRGYLLLNTADMNNNEDYPAWRQSGIRSLIGGGLNTGIPDAITNISPMISGLLWAIGANTNGSGDTLILNRQYFNKSQTEWKALAMNVQFVIPLATPITYSLTAPEITTLLGENNLWHDANGEISVGYKADTKLYVDNKITQAIAAALNS